MLQTAGVNERKMRAVSHFIDLALFAALSSPIYDPRKIPCSVTDLLTWADSNPGIKWSEHRDGASQRHSDSN